MNENQFAGCVLVIGTMIVVILGVLTRLFFQAFSMGGKPITGFDKFEHIAIRAFIVLVMCLWPAVLVWVVA